MRLIIQKLAKNWVKIVQVFILILAVSTSLYFIYRTSNTTLSKYKNSFNDFQELKSLISTDHTNSSLYYYIGPSAISTSELSIHLHYTLYPTVPKRLFSEEEISAVVKSDDILITEKEIKGTENFTGLAFPNYFVYIKK